MFGRLRLYSLPSRIALPLFRWNSSCGDLYVLVSRFPILCLRIETIAHLTFRFSFASHFWFRFQKCHFPVSPIHNTQHHGQHKNAISIRRMNQMGEETRNKTLRTLIQSEDTPRKYISPILDLLADLLDFHLHHPSSIHHPSPFNHYKLPTPTSLRIISNFLLDLRLSKTFKQRNSRQ